MSENIQKKDLTQYTKEGFTGYGQSVIKERAFADVRDGLKPVQRAILYEIIRCGATSDSKPTKVARIGGNVIGNWHPHGNIAVEEALVGMAQSWTNSLPPIYIKGNGGTVFGDSAAAGRYIEAKLTPAGDAYGRNLKEGIVPFIPNFDETGTMPTVLPAQLPYMLINGISEGIAVGVASVMPPHNPCLQQTCWRSCLALIFRPVRPSSTKTIWKRFITTAQDVFYAERHWSMTSRITPFM